MSSEKSFNFAKIKNFDEHIAMSIPNYDSLLEVIQSVFWQYMRVHGRVADIGCSTGKVLNWMSENIKSGTYYGVDTVDFEGEKKFIFLQDDCCKFLRN